MRIVTYSDDLKDPVIRFMKMIWQELGRTWEPDGREKEFSAIPQTYQTAGGEFWVALDDADEVIGTAALKPLGHGEGELARLYLDPDQRGKGIGRDLARLVIEKARAEGLKTLKLDTSRALMHAYNLFQKLGFKEIKRYFDDDRMDVLMKLDLTSP